jgi:hypothetical protein
MKENVEKELNKILKNLPPAIEAQRRSNEQILKDLNFIKTTIQAIEDTIELGGFFIYAGTQKHSLPIPLLNFLKERGYNIEYLEKEELTKISWEEKSSGSRS